MIFDNSIGVTELFCYTSNEILTFPQSTIFSKAVIVRVFCWDNYIVFIFEASFTLPRHFHQWLTTFVGAFSHLSETSARLVWSWIANLGCLAIVLPSSQRSLLDCIDGDLYAQALFSGAKTKEMHREQVLCSSQSVCEFRLHAMAVLARFHDIVPMCVCACLHGIACLRACVCAYVGGWGWKQERSG